MGFICGVCGKSDGFHGECGKAATESESTETLGYGGWVSVYNGLPEEGQLVVLYRPRKIPWPVYEVTRWDGSEDNYTHWLLLPEAP